MASARGPATGRETGFSATGRGRDREAAGIYRARVQLPRAFAEYSPGGEDDALARASVEENAGHEDDG
jgi:hypothetical protein